MGHLVEEKITWETELERVVDKVYFKEISLRISGVRNTDEEMDPFKETR